MKLEEETVQGFAERQQDLPPRNWAGSISIDRGRTTPGKSNLLSAIHMFFRIMASGDIVTLSPPIGTKLDFHGPAELIRLNLRFRLGNDELRYHHSGYIDRRLTNEKCGRWPSAVSSITGRVGGTASAEALSLPQRTDLGRCGKSRASRYDPSRKVLREHALTSWHKHHRRAECHHSNGRDTQIDFGEIR